MKKKAVSLILSLCMTFSLFVQFVPLVKAEEISDIPDPWVNPQDYVDGTATFNLDWLVSFVCAKNPQEVTFDDIISEEYQYYFGAQEVSSETLLNVKGYITANDMLWFEVEAAEGSSIPDMLAENPYLLYMATEVDAPALLITAPSSDDGSADDPAQEEPPVDDGVLLPPPLDSEHYTIEEIGQKGYFNQNEVILYNEPLGTALSVVSVPVSQLDDFIDVVYKVTDNRYSTPTVWYVIRGTDNCEAVKDWQYVYLPAMGTDLVLVDNDVTEAYEKLLKADKVDEFDEIAEELGSDIFEKFTEKHIANLGTHYDKMVEAETITYTRNDITYKGRPIAVNVTGIIPENVTLVVSEVDDGTVLDDDFDIDKAEDIILALDIKLIDEQGNEWQPKNNRQIEVAIDVAGLGIADGTIFQLEHKHGDKIHKFDVFIVMDGKLTVRTNGFSLYVVSKNDNADVPNRPGNNAKPLYNANANITMEVGDVEYFYADPSDSNPSIGTWQVEDPTGAIYWEVYTSNSASNSGVYAPWIKIVALKEIDNLNLKFVYRNNGTKTENYYLDVIVPKPTNQDIAEDGYRLYIKDDVNETGKIFATLVDASGKEVLDDEGNPVTLSPETTYSWERSDDAFIIPYAYGENNASIDIARDHAGVLQNRIDNNGNPKYVKYTVTATLPDGRVKTADYTVYYQSEIINAGFEYPKARTNDYTFFPNSMAKLFWKTTSPGENGNLTKDIEYASFNANTNTQVGGGFWPEEPYGGAQIAEINAEKYGALYQDIITAPHESVNWQFYHSRRNEAGKNGSRYEALFLIMGPTEQAQAFTDLEKIDAFIDDIVKATSVVNGQAVSNDTILKSGGMVKYKHTDGAEYSVWYHDADNDNDYTTRTNAWKPLEGQYEVPEGQYRTRLFFASDPRSTEGENYGNLIDSAAAGQYKTYLIEYYEETYVNNKLEYTYIGTKADNTKLDEKGSSILYASVPLNNFDYFEKVRLDLVSSVLINGINSPYNIKYANTPALFIEHYPTAEGGVTNFDPNTNTGKDYTEYDIVMQVFFRNTIIAVQKVVEFPKVPGTQTEALTPIEKQTLVDGLKADNGNGYETYLELICTYKDKHYGEEKTLESEAIYIEKNDPKGWYTGYIPMGDNPEFDHKFRLHETEISELKGLELDKVTFEYYQFNQGDKYLHKTQVYGTGSTEYPVVKLENNVPYAYSSDNSRHEISCEGIEINDVHRLAEIKITNTYREEEVKVNYKVVGYGGIDVQEQGDNTPKVSDSETFLYYSGKSKGVTTHQMGSYTFAGWFLDEECTEPVTKNHGYVDSNGGFLPSPGKIVEMIEENPELKETGVTFYAKFDTGSLQIVRTNAEPGQTFVYRVEDDGEGANKKVIYVTVTADENGKGSTNIVNVQFDRNYTVTQVNDWSWRYNDTAQTKLHQKTEGLHGATNMMTTFTFSGEEINDKWLNGNSAVVKNVYGGVS